MFDDPPKMPKWKVPAIFLGGTRLVEKKGLRYMIEASRILRDKGIAHRVDLVGPGDLYQELDKMIDVLDYGIQFLSTVAAKVRRLVKCWNITKLRISCSTEY